MENSVENLQFFPPTVNLSPPLKGFPLELCIGSGVSRNWNDGVTRGSKNF